MAIKLPEEHQLILVNICFGLNGAHWIAAENFHITLRFLGDLDDIQLRDLDEELSKLQFPVFELGFQGFGYFEQRGNIHTLWTAITKNKALEDLQSKVDNSIRKAGIEIEHRKFIPHVTLARCKRTPNEDIGRYIETHSPFSINPIMLNQFSLFESHNTNKGATYQQIVDYPLQMTALDIGEQPN